jgi:hypothetical protein
MSSQTVYNKPHALGDDIYLENETRRKVEEYKHAFLT